MAEGTPMSDAERKKLEQRRDRLMQLLKEGDGSGGGEVLDADVREDLELEWRRIDQRLQRS